MRPRMKLIPMNSRVRGEVSSRPDWGQTGVLKKPLSAGGAVEDFRETSGVVDMGDRGARTGTRAARAETWRPSHEGGPSSCLKSRDGGKSPLTQGRGASCRGRARSGGAARKRAGDRRHPPPLNQT